jgi:hypothetical protein
MQVEYKLKLGRDEFVIKATVKDEKEFFETMSFYSSLPKTAPGGSDDLKLVFRTTKKGHKYYSLVSEKEKKEFKLGQNLEANGGGLFPKGWDDLYEGEDTTQDSGQPSQGRSAPLIGQPVNQTPAPTQMPIVGQVARTRYSQPAQPAQVAAPEQQAAPVALNPQVTQAATNILARFVTNK